MAHVDARTEDSYTSIKTASAVRKLVAILESKEKELCYMAAEVLASFVHAREWFLLLNLTVGGGPGPCCSASV